MERRLSFQNRIILVYSALLVVVLSLYGIITGVVVLRSQKNQIIDQYRELGRKTVQQLDNFFREMDHLALQVIYSARIKQILLQIDPGKEENFFIDRYSLAVEFRDILAALNNAGNTAMRISYFNDTGDYLSYSRRPEHPEQIARFLHSAELARIIEELKTRKGGRWVPAGHRDNWSHRSELQVFSVYREIRDLERSYGFIEVQRPAKELSKLIIPRFQHVELHLADENGELFFSSAGDSNLNWDEILRRAVPYSGEIRGAYVFVAPSKITGWTIVLGQDIRRLYAPLRSFQVLLIVFAACLVLITHLSARHLTGKLIRPLFDLRDSLYTVGPNRLSLELRNENDTHIIRQLNSGFSEMFRRIRESNDQMLIAKHHEMKAHMRALQSQMNPHILYNMLSLISSLASEGSDDAVIMICSRLADILRYISSTEFEKVPLAREREILDNYLVLMKQSYEEDLIIDLSIPEEMGSVPVPKLILHPLVENAFKHGFSEVPPPWRLTINGWTHEDRWFLKVADNGVGWKHGKAAEVRKLWCCIDPEKGEECFSQTIGGLGLTNAFLRMKMLYGENAVFSIAPGKTVAVTLGGESA